MAGFVHYCNYKSVNNILLLLCTLILFSLVGCGNDLSRSQAQKDILSNYRSNNTFSAISGIDERKAIDRELFHYVKNNLGGQSLVLTNQGRQLFNCKDTMMGPICSLKEPMDYEISVTGIAGEGNSRTVEFTWEIKKFPKELIEIIDKNGEDVATFNLYDDGWRLN